MNTPMDARTLKALKASIQHWKENMEVERFEDAAVGIEDCALCDEFIPKHDNEEDCCFGCPIRKKTRLPGCEDTPYQKAVEAKDDGNLKEFRSAAKEMYEYLLSLLPSGEE